MLAPLLATCEFCGLETQCLTAIFLIETIFAADDLGGRHRHVTSERLRTDQNLRVFYGHCHRHTNTIDRRPNRDYAVISQQDYFRQLLKFPQKIFHSFANAPRQGKTRILIGQKEGNGSAANNLIRKTPFRRKRIAERRTEDLIHGDGMRVSHEVNLRKCQQISMEESLHRGLKRSFTNPRRPETVLNFLVCDIFAIQQRKEFIEIAMSQSDLRQRTEAAAAGLNGKDLIVDPARGIALSQNRPLRLAEFVREFQKPSVYQDLALLCHKITGNGSDVAAELDPQSQLLHHGGFGEHRDSCPGPVWTVGD